MPELKHNFIAGKMNKDLDERLVPNGQYRDALNIEVASSEGSNIGTIQNILGNSRVENLVGDNFVCVGSIADEKSNKLYWFISKYDVDMILEYDIDNDIAAPVLVDLWAGTARSVLKFFGNIITGINIVDNLLFWTDDKGEPKKINIDICKAGTPNVNTHTQLSFDNNSFTGIAVEYVWPDEMPDHELGVNDSFGNDQDQHPPLKHISERIKIGKYVNFERKKLAAMLGQNFEIGEFIDDFGQIRDANDNTINSTGPTTSSYDAPGNLINSGTVSTNSYGDPDDPGNGYVFKARHYRNNEFLGVKDIKAFDNENGSYFRLHFNSLDNDFIVGDVLFGVDIKLDIEEKHITVIRPKPLKAPSVKINYKELSETTTKIPNLFETKFPRFSYRYKYRDGEFSAFAPFTEPVFNPQYTKDTTRSTDASVLYNKDNAYDIKDPHNKAMVNAIHSIDLMDFVTINMPEDIVEVDILYKQEDSPVIYSIGTIKHTDFEWHASALNHENKNMFINGARRYDGNIVGGVKDWMPAADGSYNSGRYQVTTENIYAALPANQLLRPWDNVPRKALAQEVSGSRIVYGNYFQNYTIESNPMVTVDYSKRKQTVDSFDVKGLPSIKSQRNYQLGVIYCDEFGRETPVFTSTSGAIHIPWADSDGGKNASKSGQLVASATNNFPEWVDSIKFFVKESSGEYYNLTMERAWTGKSTYEIDNSEGHLWISFPSSDRNKISEEDYIVLKKKIGVGEEQVSFENKFKVIDIKNEAPDSIKYELVNLGTVTNTEDTNTGTKDSLTVDGVHDALFGWSDQRPDKQQDTIVIDIERWVNGDVLRPDLMPTSFVTGTGAEAGEDTSDVTDLYVSWSTIKGGVVNSSSKYKCIGGWRGSGGYMLKLNRDITEKDADIAHVNGNSSRDTSEANVDQDLVFQIERRQLKEEENFSGQFFVKISKNQISSVVETGNEITNLDKFQVTAKQGVWYWKDDISTTGAANNYIFSTTAGGPYGLTNYFGDTTSQGTTSAYIQGSGGGNSNASAAGGVARLSDWHVMWENILTELDDHPGPRWFVDSMHMASGQSEESDYAKYNCVTWAGSTPSDFTNSLDEGIWKGSAWSYPPIKKWFTEVTENETEVSEVESWFQANNWNTVPGVFFKDDISNLVTTSNLFDQNLNWTIWDSSSEKAVGVQMDGWVGSLQSVSRKTPTGYIAENHINGLEGMVTTNEYHSNGPRRWFSGMSGDEHGVGEDTKTYADNNDDINRHFVHLSFFAPGKDLHDNNWHFSPANTPTLYGKDTFMDNLQGIWGAGVFTGRVHSDKYGTNPDPTLQYSQLAMEGNYDDGNINDYRVNTIPPGPGIGFGYDLDYRELHERQWDPTFNSKGDVNNKIRDFIRNLYPGSKFRFHHKAPGTQTAGTATTALIDDEVYTIKKVQIKKLYNHTSWRSSHNQFQNTGGNNGYIWDVPTAVDPEYRSVEDMALLWLDEIDENGEWTTTPLSDSNAASYGNDTLEDLKKKIVDFGASHNRRVCYIIELDKNPTQSNSTMGNPLSSTDAGTSTLRMSAHIEESKFTDIEFLDPVQDIVLSDLNKFPAIWELSPKKQDVDLDIYYEASDNIPVRINRHTNDLFAPKGCLVEMINPPFVGDSNNVYLVEWRDNEALLEPGFFRDNGDGLEIDYTNVKFKFIRSDGSYTVAQAGQQALGTPLTTYKTKFKFKFNIGSEIEAGLSWYNCFSFGNGLESNRVRDDFNAMFITNGVKASTTIQETYEEEHRAHGLIYSGLYNSNSGINDLNQFIMAEKITKDLNPTYGSVQKLFSRNTDLVAFCEDKVLKILANKDAVFNADGNTQLTATENVLGQTVPFVGEYGISKNPESFASESYRAYFADKQRGAVLRLSRDGLTPISKAGMHDWFRDNLSNHTSLIGTYDSYKENYNLTLSNTYTENIIFNTFFRLGAQSQRIDTTVLSVIESFSGTQYQHTIDSDPLNSSIYNYTIDEQFISDVTVKNHPFIPEGYYQEEQTAFVPNIPAQILAIQNDEDIYSSPTDPTNPGYLAGSGFSLASYALEPGNDGGWWYDPRFVDNTTIDIWGTAGLDDHDAQVTSSIERTINGVTIVEGASVAGTPLEFPLQQDGGYTNTNNNNNWNPYNSTYSYDPTVQKVIIYPNGGSNFNGAATRCITRNDPTFFSANWTGNGSERAITFDRPNPTNSYVEFKDIGNTGTTTVAGATNADHPSLFNYNNAPGTPGTEPHNAFFNGDELHIQVKLTCFPTATHFSTAQAASSNDMGYNFIMPTFELLDNGSPLSSDVLCYTGNFAAATINATSYTSGSQADIYSTFKSASYPNTWGDFETQTTSTTSYSIYGGLKYKMIYKGCQGSSTVTFASTSVIPPLQYYGTNHSGNQATAEVCVGFALKFRDHNQQDTDGTPLAGVTDITETKVVDNLSIRIRNNELPYPQGTSFTYISGTSSNNQDDGTNYDEQIVNASNPTTPTGIMPLRNQLWEINKLFVRKGYGVMGPHAPAVATVYGNPVYQSTNTTYDDPTTAAIETYAGNTIPSTWGTTSGGDYVVNQAAIDAAIAAAAGQPTVSVPAIPPADVPAFVEVIHSNSNWSFGGTLNQPGSGFSAAQWLANKAAVMFGNNRTSTLQTATRQNAWTGASGTAVTWYEPGPDPVGQNPQEGNYGNSPGLFDKVINDVNGVVYNPPIAGVLNLPTDSSPTAGEAIHTNFANEYWHIYSSNGAYGISFEPNPSDPLTPGDWYMVDLEFNYQNTPSWTNTYSGGNFAHPALSSPSSAPPTLPPAPINDPSTYGWASIRGVIDPIVYNTGFDLQKVGGWGVAGGTGSGVGADRRVDMVPAWRTEYGDNRWVLRAVFNFSSNSWVSATNPNNTDNRLEVNFHNVDWQGGSKKWNIAKVICRKVTYTNATGTATNGWLRGIQGGPDLHTQITALSKRKLYYYNNSLCYEEIEKENNYGLFPPGVTTPRINEDWWTKSLSANPVLNVGDGWIFNFTVGPNPKTTVFNGELGFRITGPFGEGPAGTPLNEFTGIRAFGIIPTSTSVDYRVKFTMDTDTTNWAIDYYDTITGTYIDYSATATIDEYGASGADNTDVTAENQIGFYNPNVPSNPLSCGISNMSLTQQQIIFSGGQTGSWNFDGFDSTSEQFITWDIYWNTGLVADGRLQFKDTPLFDPNFGNGNIIVSANQYIDKVINRYEKYEISFNFKMEWQDDNLIQYDGQGLFHIYYFNSAGWGFRINNIGDPALSTAISSPNYTAEAIYDNSPTPVFLYWRVSMIVGIGDGSSNVDDGSGGVVPGTEDYAYSEFENLGVEALRDTLVVRRDPADSNELTGWIDDIQMRRYYDIETIDPDGVPNSGDEIVVYPETTVTFAEDVNGWTSFKSFIPESGLSLSKKYFTIKDGFLHRHYVPLKNNAGSWEKCSLEDADNYNHFYDHLGSVAFDSSDVKIVMNSEPSIVKTFNTLNYEGSQAFVTNPGAAAAADSTLINQNNALAWALNTVSPVTYPNLEGWKCVDIVTDLDSGSLLEFVKKEGKWFGYIKGKSNGVLDTSKFSVQGLGIASSINLIPGTTLRTASIGNAPGSSANTSVVTSVVVSPASIGGTSGTSSAGGTINTGGSSGGSGGGSGGGGGY